ncbi:hypothetical protein Tco_1424823, partial [Tanacetum coccineum]
MGKFIGTLADGVLGPEQDRVVKDLTPEEKERHKADICATNILLQEAHTNENKMTLERYSQHAIDPLAFVSIVSLQQYPTQSSSILQSAYVSLVTYPPHLADNTHLDSGHTPTDDLIENLTKIVPLLDQSYKKHLPQANNQLRTSSNTRNQDTVQNGRVVIQNVQGHIERQCTHPKRSQNSEYFKDKMLLLQAQEYGVVLDEEQLLFIA